MGNKYGKGGPVREGMLSQVGKEKWDEKINPNKFRLTKEQGETWKRR